MTEADLQEYLRLEKELAAAKQAFQAKHVQFQEHMTAIVGRIAKLREADDVRDFEFSVTSTRVLGTYSNIYTHSRKEFRFPTEWLFRSDWAELVDALFGRD